MKKIIILGSTGSIGTQTLSVVDTHSDCYEVVGLSCQSNYLMLNEQIKTYKPKFVYIENNRDMIQLNGAIMLDSLEELVSIDANIVVTSVVGIAGLAPTIAAIKSGKDIALANKETLVACGDLVMNLAREYNVKILPVDSEHSAIWQCTSYNSVKNIKKIILTASGGAFRGKSIAELANVTYEDALKHPTWNMGVKVTIDSATLMNKGLELIEAVHLFGVKESCIDIVVHKESIMHSAVMFDDNSIIAQLSKPSMVLPIQLALSYPNRQKSTVDELDLTELGSLSFERPDDKTFPCLAVARNVAAIGGTAGAIMNGANEAAVNCFISNKIGFNDIPYCIEYALENSEIADKYSYEMIVEADVNAKNLVEKYIAKHLKR